MTTIQKQDYAPWDPSTARVPVNNRKSNFSLGDKSQAPLNPYETTYNTNMNHKPLPQSRGKENINFKSSVNINGEGPVDFTTESRAK